MISSCKVCRQEYRKIPCFKKNRIDIWFTTNWTNFSYWMISTSAISQHIISTLVGLSSFSKRNLSCLACYSLTLHTFGGQSICWTDKCKWNRVKGCISWMQQKECYSGFVSQSNCSKLYFPYPQSKQLSLVVSCGKLFITIQVIDIFSRKIPTEKSLILLHHKAGRLSCISFLILN